jgi:ABC-type Mn2+/Zn2+ transport system ATPase subunit
LGAVSFDLLRGEILGLVGPNGGGKTTLIRTLLGVLRPTAGKVVRHDPRVRYGYVPQRETLEAIWPLTSLEVVVMARYPRIGLMKWAGPEDRRRARDAMNLVGVADLAPRPYGDLSGGQMRRVLLARALATEPDVIVLDEPTFGMDLRASQSMLDLVERLHRERGLTVLLATHLLDDVANLAERVAFVLDGTFRLGGVGEMLTVDSLSELYGMPVDVHTVDGRRVIRARGGGD